jgi:TonB family protein
MISPGLRIRQGMALDLSLAVIVSVWLHVIGLTVWRYVPPSPAVLDPPPRFIEVSIDISPSPELMEMEPEETAEEKQAEKKTADLFEPSASSPPDEETISLESKSPQYLSYLHQIKNQITNSWVLKSGEGVEGRDGRLLVVFTLGSDGQLLRVDLDTASGQASLDQAAMTAVRRAAPYPPFPDHIKLKRLNIRAVFDYRFKYVGIE